MYCSNKNNPSRMSTHQSTIVSVLMIVTLSWWNVGNVYSQSWDDIKNFRLYGCGKCNCDLKNSVCKTKNGNNAALSSSLPVFTCFCTCKRITGIVCSLHNPSDSDVTVLAETDLGSCANGTGDVYLCDGHKMFDLTPLLGNETTETLAPTRAIFRCAMNSASSGCWYCQSPRAQDVCTGLSPGTTYSVISTLGPASNSSIVSGSNTISTSPPVSNVSAATGTRTVSNATLPGSFTIPTSKAPNTMSSHPQDSNQTTEFQNDSSLTSDSLLYNHTQPTTNASTPSEPSEPSKPPESSNNQGNNQDSTDTRAMIIILSILGANAILAVVVCVIILNRRRKVNLFYRRQLKATRAAKTASRTHMSFNHHNSSAETTQIKTFY